MLSRKAVRGCTCRRVLPREARGRVYVLLAELYYGAVPMRGVAVPFLKLN